jgi:hypothetical protein
VALREIAAGKVTPDERPPEALEAEGVVEALPDEALVETTPVPEEGEAAEAAEAAADDADAEGERVEE